MITTNMGPTDSAIRIFLGLALLALTWIGPHSAWGYIGFVPLFIGAAGYCPLYTLLGLSSRGSFHRTPQQAAHHGPQHKVS